MTHRFLDWPPLQNAFEKLGSRRRGQESRIEEAVDIIQDVHDGLARALKFYKFVCSLEGNSGESEPRKMQLVDRKKEREIISFYVRYHYLLFQNDTTGSNALIGAWQKKLDHTNLWEDFNLEYVSGPPPVSGIKRTRSRPTRASTRKSTGGISAPKPAKKCNPLPRRRSEELHYFSDSTLTPLPSSDDEDDTPFRITTIQSQKLSSPLSRDTVPHPAAYPLARDPSDRSVWSIDQGISQNDTVQDVHMGSGDEPPPIPPQDIGSFIDPLHCGPTNSATSLTRDVQNSVDDPMNGTSVSAASFPSGREPSQSVTDRSGEKSLSAPVPRSSTAPHRKKRRKTNWYPKKSSKKKTHVEETVDQPMVVDTPTVADPEREPEPPTVAPVRIDTTHDEPFIPKLVPSDPPSLKILIRPRVSIPPIAPEIRAPLSTSCTNIPSPRLVPVPNSDSSLDVLKGPSDTPAVAVPGFSRPTLSENPPIWAQSRQEICESCDFFKSYQGGVYYCNGYAKGYLLSCFGAIRDIWHDGGRLIISHGGGKAASKLLEADHQSFKDHSVNALVNNWQTKEPLVLIADDKYEHFPFDLTRGHDGGKGYAYVVLGYYFIRHYWAEKHPADNGEGCAVRFKFAFQYCGQNDPWWMEHSGFPQTLLPPPGTDGFQTICEGTCTSCRKPSPQVYEQGWMCLRPGCKAHFQLRDVDAITVSLTYAKAFLAARPNPRAKKPAVYIPEPAQQSANGIVTTQLFHRGWHCNKCGRLSCRTKWEKWECSSCGRELNVTGRIRGHKEFRGLTTGLSFDTCDVNPVSGITKIVNVENQIGKFTFILPHNRGKIHLITSSARHNAEANEIFREFQEHANNGSLPFRRFPMKAHICRGEFLTNYFSQNSGEPYQYVGAADRTLPFDQCPRCVLHALELVSARAAMMLDERPVFNELLTAAYMEKQAMGFHTDGERGLGPIVASLSMGSAAVMKFRTLEDRKTIVLSLVLRHGDVVVMEGATIQAVYEHTVCPIGFRIAVTAREIRSENSTRGAWR